MMLQMCFPDLILIHLSVGYYPKNQDSRTKGTGIFL